VLPHLIGHDLALEDVAAGEPDAHLDVGRPEDLVGLQARLEPRREALDEVDELVRDLVATRVPRARMEVVRRVLAEDAALVRDVVVEPRRGQVQSATLFGSGNGAPDGSENCADTCVAPSGVGADRSLRMGRCVGFGA
jgi:hypothetical protein